MAESDRFLHAVEAIHAAGLDAELWPTALRVMARLLGAEAATLELIDIPSQRPREFVGFGVPPAEELAYFEHYAAINPRAAYAFRHAPTELLWDYQFFDERAMDRDPYYTGFLPRTELRYFLAAQLGRTPREATIATVQRVRRRGHVEKGDIGRMRRLVPHLRQAVDVATRLKRAREARRSLERAFDWLADGVLLVGADGAVLYANEAMQAIARADAGIRLTRGVVEFASAEARRCFAAAIAAACRLHDGDPQVTSVCDFPAPRLAGASPYIVAVRPLIDKTRNDKIDPRAVAIVFVRDPLSGSGTAVRLLRETFGFTEAEASLAQALQGGLSLADYASAGTISLNTAYTHLRHIKEKTGCRRMNALIRKLNDVSVRLRAR